MLLFFALAFLRVHGEQRELINEESTFAGDYVQNLNHKGIEIANVNNISFSLGLHTVARFQSLSQENVFVLSDGEFAESFELGAGAQTPFANLEFRVNLGDDIVVFFDGLLATQRHLSIYLAARYSEANASKFGDVAAGSVNRIQIGAGAWITERIFMKLEYVSQEAKGWDEGTTGVANFVFFLTAGNVNKCPVFVLLIQRWCMITHYNCCPHDKSDR